MNFKKIAAIGASALMLGMTVGVAAAANYPAPFVVGSSANVAVVYGTGSGVSSLDVVQAGNIQSDLSAKLGTSGSSSATTSGEVEPIDTSSDRIWLNTSLNSVKTTITKSDLPTVLADYTFSGDVTSKITSTIKLVAGAAAGGDNSGKVIFTKQPTSSDDPAIGISLGTSQTSNPLYNASATMAAINFTHADSEGEEVELFGQTFTVAADTSTTSLVLLKEAEKVSLSSDAPSATVTVGEASYTITLESASDTSATVTVTNSAGATQTKEVNEAASKRINGVDVAITNADENNLKYSASVIVGSQKVTLTNGAIVTVGESDDPIDGTYAYIVGGTEATTEIAIAVFRPDSSTDAILEGEAFTDPVFGSFKLDFAGLSSSLEDTSRGMVTVATSGDDTITVEFTDDTGNMKVFDLAHNESGSWFLGDSSNYSFAVVESANLSYGASGVKFVVVGNEDYGHLLELYDVYNQTTGAGAISNDRVKFRDVFSGDVYETTFSAENSGTVDIDGKRYTVTFYGTGEDAYVHLKYPTSDAAATEFVVYPTIKMDSGALISLYEPVTIDLSNMNGVVGGADASKLWFPDGDGYTGITVSYDVGGNATHTSWTINSVVVGTGDSLVNASQVTIGQLLYNITGTTTVNNTKISLVNPEGSTGGALEANPGLIIFEGKDDDTLYHAVFLDLESAPAGTSTDGVGVSDILFTSTKYHVDATRASDSDFTEDIDWYGTLTVKDASDSDQKTATISIPKSQVYAQIYLGEASSSVSGGSSGTGVLGDVLVKDSEVSSVSSKNLIVVGGSCINSVAANLLGGAYCGSSFTDQTTVGAGEYLIQSFGDAYTSGKIALLVAGYDAADTVNGATYLRTQTVDTAASKKYVGTSSTSAELM